MKTMSIYDCDPDFRRDPKTSFFCVRCQKDLKPGQPYRLVHLINGGSEILHPSEYEAFSKLGDSGDCGLHPVGSDCAKKIGIEWTHAPLETPA